ncbi:hypothetical protein ACFLT9_13570 [Acidobacteriota bacterium]
MNKIRNYGRSSVWLGSSFFLFLLCLFLNLNAGQDKESIDMPEEAREIYSRVDLNETTLTELGKRAVLTRFALYFQEMVTVKEYQNAFKACEQSPESRDCEREYMAWFNAKNKLEEYRRYWRDAYVIWHSNWLTRMGIPNLPDSSSGTVDLKGENKKEYDLFQKWMNANGYQEKIDTFRGERLAQLSQFGVDKEADLTIDQARQFAPELLKYMWNHHMVDEEFICRYLISVLGKNPVECLTWRSQGMETLSVERVPEVSSEISITIFPDHFIREGDWVNVIVSVVDVDGRIVSGTSVHLISEGSFEDSQEFYTNSQGIAVIPLSHNQEETEAYIYQIYAQGISQKIEIPVISQESIKIRLEEIVLDESDTFTFQPGFSRDIKVTRTQEGWKLVVQIQEDWTNWDFIIQRLLEIDYGEMEGQEDMMVYQFVAYDSQKAMDVLIDTKKILELVEIERP